MIESILVDPRIKVRNPNNLLLRARTIRVSAFDEESVNVFAQEISLAHRTGQPIIPVIIDSYGGDPYALWSMVDILKTATVPIATIIEGKAMSCGAALFTCGAEGYRFIGPHATIMIHDVSSEDTGGKSEEVKVDAQETDRLNKKMYAFMESSIGKPRGYLWKLAQKRSRTDWYLNAREAVKHNLANHMRIPAFRTTVKVEMKLEF